MVDNRSWEEYACDLETEITALKIVLERRDADLAAAREGLVEEGEKTARLQRDIEMCTSGYCGDRARAEQAEAEVERLREGNETTIRLLNDAITVTKRMTSGNVGHQRGALVGQLQNTRDILREKGGER